MNTRYHDNRDQVGMLDYMESRVDALKRRVKELEAEAAQKDQEISSLRTILAKWIDLFESIIPKHQ